MDHPNSSFPDSHSKDSEPELDHDYDGPDLSGFEHLDHGLIRAGDLTPGDSDYGSQSYASVPP